MRMRAPPPTRPLDRALAVVVFLTTLATCATTQGCDGYIGIGVPVSSFGTYFGMSAAGAVWCLEPGTYTGCDGTLSITNMYDEGLTLRGAGVGVTVIDCGGDEYLMDEELTSASAAFRIENMTITNFKKASYSSSSGGCITSSAPFALDRVRFENDLVTSTSGDNGVAVYAPSVSEGEIVITNCEFVDISGFDGAAVFINYPQIPVTLTNTLFERVDSSNGAFSWQQTTGVQADVVVENVTVVGCSANQYGNINLFTGGGVAVTVRNSSFTNSGASSGGAGFNIDVDTALSVVRVYDVYCEGNSGSGTGGCGQIYTQTTDFEIHRAVAIRNTVSGAGGAFNVGTDGSPRGRVYFYDCYLEDNDAIAGGGVYAVDAALTDCVFVANSASSGDAINIGEPGEYSDFCLRCTMRDHLSTAVVQLNSGATFDVDTAYICDNNGLIFACNGGSVTTIEDGCAFADTACCSAGEVPNVSTDGTFTCATPTTSSSTSTSSSSSSAPTTTTTATTTATTAVTTTTSATGSPGSTSTGSSSSADATSSTDSPSATPSGGVSPPTTSDATETTAPAAIPTSSSSTTGVSGWSRAKVPVIVGTSTGGGLCGFGICFFFVCFRGRKADRMDSDSGSDEEGGECGVEIGDKGRVEGDHSGLFDSEATRNNDGAVELDDVVTTTVPVFGDSQQFASVASRDSGGDGVGDDGGGATTAIIPHIDHASISNRSSTGNATAGYNTVAGRGSTGGVGDETATVPVDGLASRPSSGAYAAANRNSLAAYPGDRSQKIGGGGGGGGVGSRPHSTASGGGSGGTDQVIELEPALGVTTHLIAANLHRRSIGADVKVGVSAAAVTRSAPQVPGLGPASLLGEGGQASVYGALSYSLGKRVVLKVFNDADAYEREVDIILAAGEHENVVSRLDLPDLPASVLALEFASHGSLNDYTASHGIVGDNGIDHRLSPGDVLSIGLGVARGLAHLHSRGVCHLDLKPDNVLIKPGAIGSVVPLLADFGASFVVGRGDLRVDQCTVRYAAPEVVQMYSQSAEPGIHSYFALDVFSFGMLLWEMAVGERPFAELATADIIAAIIADPSLRVDVGRIETSELSKLVSLCLVPAASRSDDMPAIVASLEGLSVE